MAKCNFLRQTRSLVKKSPFKIKKLIYGFIILSLFVSCSQQSEKHEISPKQFKKTNPLTEPNLFIGKHTAKAMVLGVFHFKDEGLDSYKPKFSFDILESKRQAELETLLEKIENYRPTKILVEWNRIKMDSLTNVWYQEYLDDKTDLSDKSNEVFQIGFKLAKKLEHDKIYCTDAKAEWFGADLD